MTPASTPPSTPPSTPRSTVGLAVEAARVGLRAAPVAAVVLVALTLLAGVVPAATAWFAKLLLDQLSRGAAADGRLVVGYAVAGAATVVAGAVATTVLQVLADRLKLLTTDLLNARLFTRVNRLIGLRRFEDPRYQDELRLAQDGATEAPGAVLSFVTDTVRGLVTVGTYLGVVVALWSPLVALVLVSAGCAVWAQVRLARVYVEAAATVASSERRRSMYQFVMLSARAAKEIRLYGLDTFFHGRMMRALRHGNAAQLKVAHRAAVTQTVFAVAGGVIAAVGTVVVARRVLRGTSTVGDVAFLTAAVVGLQAGLAGIIDSVGAVRFSLRMFASFLAIERSAEDLPSGTDPVAPLREQIEFRDVWFRYGDGPWILRGASFTLRHGETVGLVGLNGAGKSTIVKLLCRFYDPHRGSIRWDGRDLRDLDVADLRRRFGATYQDFMEFDLTARDSIGIGDLRRADDVAPVRRAARLAGVDDLLATLPNGYSTMLSRVFLDESGEDTEGVVLSGGQWQRVALARSLMRDDADVLILDEPSAGLDPVAEHDIHTTLRRHRQGRTCLLISHRLSTLRAADRILVLADGRMIEDGSHDDLMAADDRYAALFRLQADGYRQAALG